MKQPPIALADSACTWQNRQHRARWAHRGYTPSAHGNFMWRDEF